MNQLLSGSSDSESNPVQEGNTEEFSGYAPPHFYGELIKTEKGRNVLRASNHFQEFSNFLKSNYQEAENLEILGRLKSILWAVGHIGSNEDGFIFLEEEEVLRYIVEIADHSQVYSLRG
jgi:rapamycin-insensitive companion of mTOR